MSRKVWIAAGLMAAMVMQPFVAFAAEGKKHKHPSSDRRGGYSYSKEDSINTYGDGRGRYGSSNNLRDPQLERQTNSGPFDHGFFYDSGVGPGQHGNDAPFLH